MKATPLFLRLALPTPLRQLFDYLPPQAVDPKALIPGIRVRVPFGSRSLIGILVEVSNHSAIPVEKLKQATSLLDHEPIYTPDIYQLCQWASDYYHCSLGDVFATALPALLRKGKPPVLDAKWPVTTALPPCLPVLNEAQQNA